MNLIFFRLIKVSTKKGWKTVLMRVAHCCNSFPLFFLVDTSNNKKYITWKTVSTCIVEKVFFFLVENRLDFYLIIWFSLHSKRQNSHSNPFKCRIISNFSCCRDTYDITIKFFSWCKNHLNFSTNQNKRYAITLINIKWYVLALNVCFHCNFLNTLYMYIQ